MSIVAFFFSVSLPMASQGRSLVFSAILIETHSSSAVRSKKILKFYLISKFSQACDSHRVLARGTCDIQVLTGASFIKREWYMFYC